MVAPFTTLTGRLFRSSRIDGVPFTSTLYSVEPIFVVPEGRMRFCTLMAFTTSWPVIPLAFSAWRSRSTETTFVRPPYGHGICAPFTTERPTRICVCARSYIDCSFMVALLKEYCSTGTVEAL